MKDSLNELEKGCPVLVTSSFGNFIAYYGGHRTPRAIQVFHSKECDGLPVMVSEWETLEYEQYQQDGIDSMYCIPCGAIDIFDCICED